MACYYYTTGTLNEYEMKLKMNNKQKKDYIIGINQPHSPMSSCITIIRGYISRIITV